MICVKLAIEQMKGGKSMGNQEYLVQRALHAAKELCECVKGMDAKHQHEAFLGCLEIIAREMN